MRERSLEVDPTRKRNRRKRDILLALPLLVLLCTGCGRQDADAVIPTTPPLTEDGDQLEGHSALEAAPLLQWEDSDNENLADMLQRECGSVMVRLEAGGLVGSGVIYSAVSGELVIVTAAHVLTAAEDGVRVVFVDGWETQGTDFFISGQADLGVVRISLDQIPEDKRQEYLTANVDKKSYDSVQAGNGCIVMGSRSGVAEDAYEGIVLEPWIYMEDYGQYMMWVSAYGKPGMSGGGLFDRQGHFLGVLSGLSEDGDWAVVPLALLFSEL